MSYATGTTHYNLPQTVGTDKRDWFDTNQAFSDIDAAIYGAVQSASESASAITALTTRVGTNETNIADLQTSRTTDEANISALQTLTSQHTTQIADVRADALDMICAVDEGTAQVAAVAVSEGNYFRYNDVLYIATSDIAVGDTIIPNTNCRATNVATELVSAGQKVGDLSSLQTTTKTDLVSAVNEVLSLVGGDNMKSKLYTGTSSSVPAAGRGSVQITFDEAIDLTKCSIHVIGQQASMPSMGAGATGWAVQALSTTDMTISVANPSTTTAHTYDYFVQVITWD